MKKQRQQKQIRLLDPPTIRSELDIREVIGNFLPSEKKVLRCDSCRYPQTENQRNELSVGQGCPVDLCDGTIKILPYDSNARLMLLDGFDVVRRRYILNKELNSGFSVDDMSFWVDEFISRNLGGKRSGFKILWAIGDKRFFFDPLSGELSVDSGQAS